MNIEKLITIVIPSFNEDECIYNTLHFISNQKFKGKLNVIIADANSTDGTLKEIIKAKSNFKNLSIKVIKGGYPAYGRLEGSKLVDTPYILFLDADVFLTNPNTLVNCMKYNKDLLSVPFYTDFPYGWVFRVFDIFQFISSLIRTPFAIGGFQLWKTETYWSLGGYNPEELFAEDYSLSHKVNPKNFKVVNLNGTYTSSRRFKKKGILWMFYIMIKSFLNRNNPEFFKQTHNYWS
jgi:glycosyltransferase involved in cell wall biosynthesis